MIDPKRPLSNQTPDETVYLILRRHWSHFVKLGAVVLLLILVPLTLLWVMPDSIWGGRIGMFMTLAFSLYYLMVVLYSFTIWMDSYFDLGIISDRRLVDITQASLFNRTQSELHLERIQDVEVRSTGFLQSMLGFGDVFIQTAGIESNGVPQFHFDDVNDPVSVSRTIMQLAERLRNEGSVKHEPRSAEELVGELKEDLEKPGETPTL